MPALNPLRAATALVLLAAPSLVQAQSGFTDPDRLAKLRTALPEIDRIAREFVERNHVPGAAWGIVVDGKLIHAGVAGLREVASRSPVDTSTVFRIASMSKSFAAASILKLRDEGKLSLEDLAEKYVPELKGLKYPTTDSPRLTIRHLLSHSAGFPEDNPWGDQQLAETEESLSRMMRSGIPFSNPPGIAYEYSNYGFAILGRIVANVSGMSYTRYLTENILKPLGMTSTFMEAGKVPPARLAHGYRWQDSAWLEEPQLPDGSFGPMGGMLTSLADLSRWVGLMLAAFPARDGADAGPVSRASLREMQQVARYGGGFAARQGDNLVLSAGGYGYGLGVRQFCRFRISVAHSGGLPGFGSNMRWLPEYGVGFIGLGSLTYTGWGGVGDRVFEALAKTGGLEPRMPVPAPVLVDLRERVTRLVNNWGDALADSVAAVNLYMDESKPRRQRAIEQLKRDAGGSCRNDGPFVVENALRGEWKMQCATGALAVSITLAPTTPAKVQFLEVRALKPDEKLGAAPACRP
jgi:CubicO group peptidase (beta-lactamase class C family)